MQKMSRFFIVWIVLAALLIPIRQVSAATNLQAAVPVTGTVTLVTVTTDSLTGLTTVTVTLTDAGGLSHSVNINSTTAAALGLVTVDALTGAVTVATTAVGSQVTIDAASQIPNPVTGTVTQVTVNTDSLTGLTTVTVTLTDAGGLSQTINISSATAAALGLVTVDALTGAVTVATTAVGSLVTIDGTSILPDQTPVEPVVTHPVAVALAKFFDLEPAAVMDLHEAGTGFGVIAQACFLSFQLTGDASLCEVIIDAKKSGEFGKIPLPDGVTVSNWGQFKKLASDNKGPLSTLGAIMSGRADAGGTTPESGTGVSSTGSNPSQVGPENSGNENSPGQSGESHGNSKGQDNDKNNGNQEKDKPKGNKNK